MTNFRLLNSFDNNQLLSLTKLRNTGTELFTVSRDPDFFSLSKSIGHKFFYYGTFDNSGNIQACIGLTLQHRKFKDNQPLTAGYIHDLRTRPGAPYSLIKTGIAFCVNQFRSECDIFIANILDSNSFKRGFLKKRLLPEPFNEAQASLKITHSQLLIQRYDIPKKYNIKKVDSNLAWEFYLKNSKPSSLIEPSVITENEATSYSINENDTLIGIFFIVTQNSIRNLISQDGQVIPIHYISYITSALNRTLLLKIISNYFNLLKDSRLFFYASFNDNETMLGTEIFKSNVFIWHKNKSNLINQFTEFYMELNEI